MTKTTQSALVYPVHVLRDHCTAVEAAMALVLAKPRQKPVHRLRTETRRIEAQLELLSLLARSEPTLRGLGASAKKVRKLLAEVRRAAGRVRDMDVQRELIRGSIEEDAKKRMRKDAKSLRRALKEERAGAAEELLADLKGHARKLGPRLERMLEALEPAFDVTVSPAVVTKQVREWYAARTVNEDGSEARLHGVRKAAKLARYMVASAGDAKLSGEFENVQNLGGGWHDSLTLRRTAHDHLGKDSALVKVFAEQEGAMLAEFRGTLGLGEE